MAFFPGNLEVPFFLESSYVFWRRIHDRDPFGSVLSLSVAAAMTASVVDGVESTADIEHRNLLSVYFDDPVGAGGDLADFARL